MFSTALRKRLTNKMVIRTGSKSKGKWENFSAESYMTIENHSGDGFSRKLDMPSWKLENCWIETRRCRLQIEFAPGGSLRLLVSSFTACCGEAACSMDGEDSSMLSKEELPN